MVQVTRGDSVHAQRRRRIRILGRTILLAGLAAGFAMIPLGLALRASGQSVNVYGEMALRALVGRSPPGAMLLFHLAVSVALAVPFVALVGSRPRAGLIAGLLYGALAWALVNGTLLPLVFARPTAWQVGLAPVWGSLAVHLLYGAVLGTATCWLGDRSFRA